MTDQMLFKNIYHVISYPVSPVLKHYFKKPSFHDSVILHIAVKWKCDSSFKSKNRPALVTSFLFCNMWLIKQVRRDFTFSALLKSTYYKKYGNASVLLKITVQRTKCIIVFHSKNMLTWRKVDTMAIVYLEFFWRNYHCCPLRGWSAYFYKSTCT